MEPSRLRRAGDHAEAHSRALTASAANTGVFALMPSRAMAPGHWQIVKYRADGSSREGGFRTFDLSEAPPGLIDVAVARQRRA
jgi:hypothetical protein